MCDCMFQLQQREAAMATTFFCPASASAAAAACSSSTSFTATRTPSTHSALALAAPRSLSRASPPTDLTASLFSQVRHTLSARGRGGSSCRAQVTTMPVGAAEDPYQTPQEGGWQWVDIWNVLYQQRIIIIGFAVVILMRGSIVRELAYWVLWFGRFALYAAEALTVVFAGIMHFAAEPVAMVLTLAGWAALAATDVYHFVVDTTPVQALLNSLLLSSAVLSLRDATATAARVNGSPEQGVGIATILALAGVLELVSPETLVLSLVALSAYLLLVRKADPVTVFMPATVTFVAISEPILQAVAFALFVILTVHANWKSTLPQPTQPSLKPRQSRLSVVLVAVTSAIFVSVATRALYARSIAWLLVR